MANLTFIGGSFDMARRVMDVQSHYIRVPRMREVQTDYIQPVMEPQFETVQVDTYRVHKIGEDHYIAIFEGLH